MCVVIRWLESGVECLLRILYRKSWLALGNKKIELMSVRCLGVLIFHIFQVDLWKRTVLKLLSTRFFISATFKRHSIVGPLETFLLYSQMNRTPKKTLSFLFFLLPSNNNNFYTLFAETIFSSSAFMTLTTPLWRRNGIKFLWEGNDAVFANKIMQKVNICVPYLRVTPINAFVFYFISFHK